MLRLLQSSQPVAWGIVPLTSALLFALGGWMAFQGGAAVEVPWSAWLAVLVSARWIHRMYLESGMRTRPGMVPSWAWVLAATPMLWTTPNSWWWGMALLWVSVGQGLRLRLGEPRPDLHFWLGVPAGLAPMLAPELAAWCLVLGGVLFVWRTPKASEALMWALGMATPWWIRGGVTWWATGSVAMDAMPWSECAVNLSPMVWALAPMAAVGWVWRQQSLIRATARQRVVRKWTQWPGLLTAVIGVVATGVGLDHCSGQALRLTGSACVVMWTLAWCFPPGWKGTKIMPWLALALSSVATLGPAIPGL